MLFWPSQSNGLELELPYCFADCLSVDLSASGDLECDAGIAMRVVPDELRWCITHRLRGGCNARELDVWRIRRCCRQPHCVCFPGP